MCLMNEHWVSLLLNALQYAVVLHSIPALLIILISLKKNYYRRPILFIIIKWKNKKYHAVGTVPNSNRKMVERGKIATTNTQIHDRSLSWLDAGFSIKRSAVKLVYVPILPHTLLLVKLCCYVSVFHM